jgi:RHS repeat-associated protein
MDRWTNIVWRDSSSNVVAGFAYGYDSAGLITQNVLTVNNALITYNYSYDSLDRLIAVTSASLATSVVTYAYDLAGNRTQMVDNAATSAYAFGSGDRLVSWGTNAENTVQYDVAGNVTNMGFGAGRTVSLTWNARYQLTSAATNGATVERYGYDALGRRAWTADGSVTNWHVYDGHHVVADVDATGGVLRAYSYGPGIDNILAMTVHANDGGTSSVSSVFYYVKDHLGTVHALVDAGGSVVERYEYDAWGRVLGVFDGAGNALVATALGNRYLWQGREYSWATRLYFFRARWYDPITGRWLSNDPIGISGGLNQYVFCANNPVNRRDAFGLVDDWAGALGFDGPIVSPDPQAFAESNESRSRIQGQVFFGEVAVGWMGEAVVGTVLLGGAAAIVNGPSVALSIYEISNSSLGVPLVDAFQSGFCPGTMATASIGAKNIGGWLYTLSQPVLYAAGNILYGWINTPSGNASKPSLSLPQSQLPDGQNGNGPCP